jgi:nucleotide-binding universal stress UspA family protein
MIEQGMSQPVLAAYDGSTVSREAVALAAEEAAARASSLVVIQAVEAPVDGRSGGRRLEHIVDEAQAEHPCLAVSGELLTGDPVEAILERSRSSCLLVFGRRRHVGAFSTSIVARVLADATVPMIVHRPLDEHHDPQTRAVLVGVLSAGEAEAALEFGFFEAALRGSDLTAMHLGSPEHTTVEEEEARLAELVAAWAEKYPEVSAGQVVRPYPLDPAVTLTAASHAAQLVVVGASCAPEGRLDSVNQAVVDRAGCPVAVVPICG